MPESGPSIHSSPPFIGRERELNVLSRLFDAQARVVVLEGLPGIGKTALARAFAATRRDLFPGGITFTSAADRHRLRFPRETLRRFLVVVDDAEFLPEQTLAEIADQIRKTSAARVLFVGRPETDVSSRDASVTLEPLDRAAAMALVRAAGATADPEPIVDYFGGNPRAVLTAISELMNGETWASLLERLRDFDYEGVLGRDGRPLRYDDLLVSPILADIEIVNDDILGRLYRNPGDWYDLAPRKFEEITARILEEMGYVVHLTPESRDGGFDICAAKKDGFGEFLFLVECKRYSPNNKVGVHLVRALNGTLSQHRVNGAALVTTSYFTKGAREYAHEFEKTLKLHDFLALQQWLADLRGSAA
jgi:restriction endonuclease/AAA ATPase-like protein